MREGNLEGKVCCFVMVNFQARGAQGPGRAASVQWPPCQRLDFVQRGLDVQYWEITPVSAFPNLLGNCPLHQEQVPPTVTGKRHSSCSQERLVIVKLCD